MRIAAVLALALFLPGTASLALDDRLPDPQSLSALESKAEKSPLQDQVFLYAQLTHAMTELASHQMAIGDGRQAAASIAAVQKFAAKLHENLARDTKKLKDAEILMRHSAFRLREVMGGSSADDRPLLESTLKQLNQVETELMLQLFQR